MSPFAPQPVAVVDGALLCPGDLSWEDLRSGHSAAVRLPETFPIRVGAPCTQALSHPTLPRGTALALEALQRLELDPDRTYGLVLGLPSLLSETAYVETALVHRNHPDGMRPVTTYTGRHALQRIAEALPQVGPCIRVDAACATGNDALIVGAEWLQAGLVDDVVVVCASAMLNPVGTALFHNLKALNDRDDLTISCPFDLRRRGFMMGEGAAVAWLSNQPTTSVRGWLCGYGQSMNAAGFTDLPEDQNAMLSACREALGGLDRVAYISAHGTATLANDAAETRLYRTLFGRQAEQIPLSSIKSMIGHTLGAAALIEALVCLEALREQTAPPTIHYKEPDPDCDLNVVPNQAAPIQGNFALSNAFAFGGHNSCVLLARERP